MFFAFLTLPLSLSLSLALSLQADQPKIAYYVSSYVRLLNLFQFISHVKEQTIAGEVCTVVCLSRLLQCPSVWTWGASVLLVRLLFWRRGWDESLKDVCFRRCWSVCLVGVSITLFYYLFLFSLFVFYRLYWLTFVVLRSVLLSVLCSSCSRLSGIWCCSHLCVLIILLSSNCGSYFGSLSLP